MVGRRGKEEKTAGIKEQYKKFIGRKILFIFFLLLLILAIAGVAATLGSYPISVPEVYSIIWNGLFQNPATTKEIVVWKLRLPVILMGVLAGIGLAIAGTMMQGIVRNPLASPYTLGISSGAGFGAVIAIIYGTGVVSGVSLKYLVVANAFVFSLIPVLVIMGLARFKRATPETMILAGVAMMYIFSGYTHLIFYFADPEAMKEAYFWTVGGLGRASWPNLTPMAFMLALCVPVLMWKSWDLNVMGAGDETAKSLGVNAERARLFIMVVSSLLTASIISFTGCIGFVGLVAPHVCRIIIGGDNRFLIPASGLFGAAFLLGMSTLGRTIIAPVIIPAGVMMACIGGPFFFFILLTRKREYW
ncbi:iron ABC transporter permease [ANME-1 cluster archaeon ex4572_4]|nr:MAG: iron ABC transporter permease [ANME-1 cluster archaeon ex4572_4]HDN67968.1 iron ABC transporter permease [Methanomicrobia archaeon]